MNLKFSDKDNLRIILKSLDKLANEIQDIRMYIKSIDEINDPQYLFLDHYIARESNGNK